MLTKRIVGNVISHQQINMIRNWTVNQSARKELVNCFFFQFILMKPYYYYLYIKMIFISWHGMCEVSRNKYLQFDIKYHQLCMEHVETDLSKIEQECLHCNVKISFQHLRGVKQIPIFLRFNVTTYNSSLYCVLLRGISDTISAEVSNIGTVYTQI